MFTKNVNGHRMPAFTLKAPPKNNKTCLPISIMKGETKTLNNKLLYLDTQPRVPKEDKPFIEVELPFDTMFSLMPSADEDFRQVWYITGSSGSGKSYMAKMYANNYSRMYPDRPIYLISKLTEDETIDGMETKPIRLDYSNWIEDPPNINDFNNALVIFDDYDTIDGKEGKAVLGVIEDLCIMGRKHNESQGNVSVLLLTHHLTNYKKTRLLLNEATHYVVYPQNSSAHALGYLLKTHMGLDKEDLKKMKKLGRWVCFSKNYPQYMMGAHYAKLLHMEDVEEEEEKGGASNIRCYH